MRKVLVDLNLLGLLSTSTIPFPSLFHKVSQNRNRTLQSDDLVKYYFCPKQKSVEAVDRTGKRSLSSFKNMEEDSQYSDIFYSEENLEKRLNTFEDIQLVLSLLKEIIEYNKNNVSSWIIESKVKKLCSFYKCFLKNHKYEFIQVLAQDYGVNHKQVFLSAQALAAYSELSEVEAKSDAKIIKNEDQLHNLLTPQYSWLFLHIGKLEKGVKFLVDLRTDVLNLIAERNAENQSTVELQQLNITLRDLLSLWFSIGFLHLKRVTWSSSCELLQKISEYEAVHPVRSWTDLKRRVGPYRRCFVFLHGSMPGEPIVVLHTALCDEIASSMKGIVSARSRMSGSKILILETSNLKHLIANFDFIESDNTKPLNVFKPKIDHSSGKEALDYPQEEISSCVKAAVFYSISSTQKGLQGIELGNYLIKSVVHELQIEFPHMTQFSSLSPIPNFRSWLLEKLKASERGPNEAFLQEEIRSLKARLSSTDFWRELRRLFSTNSWTEDKDLVALLEKPLMRLCARYLFVEKHRGYALDSVANFHLKNGAVMWRLNWLADTSPRGFGNSCSIMVNYRYFLDDTEFNSRTYLEKQIISASEEVVKLVEQAQQLIIVSKI